MSIAGISGSENVESQSMSMMFGDVLSASFTGPKICGNLIYDSLESF